MDGVGSVSVDEIIRATVIGLDRKPKTDEIVKSLAWRIKERLKI